MLLSYSGTDTALARGLDVRDAPKPSFFAAETKTVKRHYRKVFLADVGVVHLGRRWAYFTTIVLPAIGRSPKRPIEISWKPGVRPVGTMILIW